MYAQIKIKFRLGSQQFSMIIFIYKNKSFNSKSEESYEAIIKINFLKLVINAFAEIERENEQPIRSRIEYGDIIVSFSEYELPDEICKTHRLNHARTRKCLLLVEAGVSTRPAGPLRAP